MHRLAAMQNCHIDRHGDGKQPYKTRSNLGVNRRIWFFEYSPDGRLEVLPKGQFSVVKPFFVSEFLHDVFATWFLCVKAEVVDDGKRRLCVSVCCVCHPTARLHLVGIQTPEFEFLFEQRSAYVGWVVQLPGPIVVQDLKKTQSR